MLLAMLILGQEPAISANESNFVSAPVAQFAGSGSVIRFDVRGHHEFTDVIPSWTANTPGDSAIVVWLAVDSLHRYCLGQWGGAKRTSVNNQKDEVGQVDTDTLTLVSPTQKLHVEVQLFPSTAGAKPELTSFHLILGGNSAQASPRESLKSQWGRNLEPPRRPQSIYPGGYVLCSPTSVSMTLGYWAKKIGQKQLDHDVPEVQKGVYDPGWPGTGNWPFNTAFAGSQPGMTGYVSRFRDVRDLEEWIARDVPVITSVSYGLLKGHGKVEPNDGHLVVLVGFDSDGNPIFNDPGRNIVRLGYKREDFIQAWSHSKNTVYLIYPRLWRTPTLPGPWDQK